MKIIDSNGVEIATPDLTKGSLKQETQTIHHDAVAGGTPAIYYDADGREKGRDVRKVVDVPGVEAQEAYDEEVEVQRYVLYTAEELAAQEKARKEAEEKAQLPTAEERLAALEAAMLDLLAAQ